MLMEQEDKTSGRKSKGKQKEDKYELIKPTELKKILDKYIIGQDEAKKTICVSVYNHYKKNFFGDEATADEVRAYSRHCSRLSRVQCQMFPLREAENIPIRNSYRLTQRTSCLSAAVHSRV